MLGRALEVNMTINDSWGYNLTDLHWKSASSSFASLGHREQGWQLPAERGTDRRRRNSQPEVIASWRWSWLKTNGEAIYATEGVRSSPRSRGSDNAEKHPGGGTTLYVHVWEWPMDGKILLPGVKQSPLRPLARARWRGDLNGHARGLVVTLPGAAPDADVSVAALEFAGPLEGANARPLLKDTGASGTLADPSKSPPSR